MLAERDTQIDAEEDSCSQPSAWREVYNLMRCLGPPCRLGPHCWQDPEGKKHYKLKTPHLRSLVKYVEKGGALQTHEDMPNMIREQLYGEEHQRLERHHRETDSLAPTAGHGDGINILGPRDIAVKKYTKWQESNVMGEITQGRFSKGMRCGTRKWS
ncbi:hypothetical protein ACJ73_01717 [Blastomyces percursus]|uniref:Uncharacterized protein n=1 Tax=Blastomyces percursus TaxID=1658174 RepID=A0A1J9RE79_9EURO|nr:hypothetical protein ACJ73_01717 [Blastomyces percursus]